MTYRHVHGVRYGEVDAQRVVYNAHYLAWCDDAVEEWLASLEDDLDVAALGWDFMLRRAVIEWQGSTGLRDHVEVEVGVGRWGTASFDLWFTGRVADRPAFTATITYVGVRLGSTETMATPAEVRTLLGDPVAAPPP